VLNLSRLRLVRAKAAPLQAPGPLYTLGVCNFSVFLPHCSSGLALRLGLIAGCDRLRSALQEFGDERCRRESVDFGGRTDLLDVGVVHYYDAIG
jgi:hypothetical protein